MVFQDIQEFVGSRGPFLLRHRICNSRCKSNSRLAKYGPQQVPCRFATNAKSLPVCKSCGHGRFDFLVVLRCKDSEQWQIANVVAVGE
jgi:ribosomal protein L32